MNASNEERILKSLWHAMIAAVGILEFRRNGSLAAKTLAVGLIAFHIDAAVFDALDRPTTLQRLLRKLR
jgi:hypothetical protein